MAIVKSFDGQYWFSGHMESKPLYKFLQEHNFQQLQLFMYKNMNGVYIPMQNDTFVSFLMSTEMDVQDPQFLSYLGHELRTPLNGMIGILTMLQETIVNDKQEQYVNALRTSLGYTCALTNNILEFSQIESGSLTIKEITFDLQDVIRSLRSIFMSRIQEKQIDLAFIVDSNCPQYLFSDDSKLKQVLVNLISNAIKFSNKRGSVLVTFTYDLQDQQLRVQVQDHGFGISQDMLNRVFHNSVRPQNGSGLGLLITKSIIEAMQGSIQITYSKPGQGTTILFNIPARKSEPTNIQYIATNLFEGKYAMIVDDNAANRLALYQMLGKWGFIPIMFQNEMEALMGYKMHQFDIVFLDICMDDTNGNDLLIKLKNERQSVFIAVSSLSIPCHSDFFGVIQKPIEEQAIIQMSSKALNVSMFGVLHIGICVVNPIVLGNLRLHLSHLGVKHIVQLTDKTLRRLDEFNIVFVENTFIKGVTYTKSYVISLVEDASVPKPDNCSECLPMNFSEKDIVDILSKFTK